MTDRALSDGPRGMVIQSSLCSLPADWAEARAADSIGSSLEIENSHEIHDIVHMYIVKSNTTLRMRLYIVDKKQHNTMHVLMAETWVGLEQMLLTKPPILIKAKPEKRVSTLYIHVHVNAHLHVHVHVHAHCALYPYMYMCVVISLVKKY